MLPDEEPLTGGNASSFVIRRGRSVHKPWTASSVSVQRLLAHLRPLVDGVVPEPQGRDEQGRQMLEFVPGVEAMDDPPFTPAEGERVGAMVRALHTAAASFVRLPSDEWTTVMRRPGDEIIGHSDLAPWNLIRGDGRWTFIDWDGAGPTTRIADLAYAARAFAFLDHEHPLERSLPILRSILTGYRADAADRAGIVAAMIERTEAMRDLLLASVASGREPWARMATDGHAAYWTDAAQHLRRHRDELAAAVR